MNVKIPKDLESLKEIFAKAEGKNRYYIFVGILVFVILLDYFILMRPQLSSLGKINPEIKTISENIKNARNDIKKLKKYEADLEDVTKRFEEANVKVKSKDGVSFFLEHIAYVASETGVKIDQIMPDMLGQQLVTKSNQRAYYDIPIYLEARSGYHELGRFLNKIEQNDISLRTAAFSVVVTNDTRLHAVKTTFKATVYEEVKEEPVPEKKKKGKKGKKKKKKK